MKTVQSLLKLIRDKAGATAIEYALIGGIICIAVIGGATALGQSANGAYVDVNDKVWGAGGGGTP
jgi:pilus assembly protein Flp/PilA